MGDKNKFSATLYKGEKVNKKGYSRENYQFFGDNL